MIKEPQKAILIVDDHPMLRLGLSALIKSDPGLTVCGTAESCQEALALIADSKQQTPDLAIVDLGLEGGRDGLHLIKDIQAGFPQIMTLVLSMHDESIYAERAINAGARGYLTKQQVDETVLVAIHQVLSGRLYLSQEIGDQILNKYFSAGTVEHDSGVSVLTDRQMEVFRLIGKGHSTREIAEFLNLSIKTIESHREHLKQKLVLNSGAELVQLATQWVSTGGGGS